MANSRSPKLDNLDNSLSAIQKILAKKPGQPNKDKQKFLQALKVKK